MAKKNVLGSAKRFGARYGRTIKHRLAKVEANQRKATKCPFCLYNKVKRLSLGIYKCSKCDAKFASKAYTIAPIKKILQEKKEQTFEFEEE